jgi:signal-transduction protein with cAMP-binding, CBS, and nucleotidyltransferase domain/DNA polymerase III epsilon subunit-like protein
MPGTTPPPGYTPLVALAAVSLDLETTGLDVARDRIVQIGLINLYGARMLEETRFDRLINPGMAMSGPAARITGLSDSDLARAPPLGVVLPDVIDKLSGRVLIGHHIAFDVAVLRHEAARLGLVWRDPPSLDIAHLLAGLEPRLADLGFESVAGFLGVTIADRHDALGDATMAGEAFRRMLPILLGAGVRTLAQAQALAARRPELRLREVEAGWHPDATGGVANVSGTRSPGRLDGIVFSKCLGAVMSAPAIFAEPEMRIEDAAEIMVDRGIGALLIGEAAEPPFGVVTERDLLSCLAGRHLMASPDTTVEAIMSHPVEGLGQDEFVYRALGRMDRLGIRHLVVTGPDGRAVGMVSQRDLLAHRGRSEALIDDAVGAATDDAGLAAAFAGVPAAAADLLADGLDGAAIARVVSRELCAVTARAAELAIDRLALDGRGPPPAPWCILVLGSGGRGESLLRADQDNALIHAGETADDPWFADFGARLADSLDVAGVPRCTGGVMASNQEWRGSRTDWFERIEQWLRRARPEDLLNVDIFFDMVPVAGDFALAEGLREEAVAAAAKDRPFLGLLARSLSSITPRLGLFGRLPVEDGRVDIKRNGLLPLVSLARSLTLADGSTVLATPDRLTGVADRGRLGRADVEALVDLHRNLMTLLVKQQLSDLNDGVILSNRVIAANLSKAETTLVRDGFKRLAAIIGDIHGLMAR